MPKAAPVQLTNQTTLITQILKTAKECGYNFNKSKTLYLSYIKDVL
jgi:hypothetical protein